MRFVSLLLILAFSEFLFGMQNPGRPMPRAILDLPDGIRSETVQIKTELKFKSEANGGFSALGGGLVFKKKNLTSIQIEGSSEGKPADEALITVAIPGCDFQIFHLPFGSNPAPRISLTCKSIPKILITGVVPPELIANHNAEIVIEYSGNWESYIGDGLVHDLELARVPVTADGTFKAEITDYSSSALTKSAVAACLYFSLRDSKTQNFLSPGPFLTPDLQDLIGLWGLRIQSAYPQIRFAR